MSIALMTEVWKLDLPATETLVLLAIADHANDPDGLAWPSVWTVACKARLSERQAQRVLRKLRDAGLLEVVERGGKSGLQRDTTVYRLRLDRGTRFDQQPPLRRPSRQGRRRQLLLGGVSPMTPGGCHPRPVGGVAHDAQGVSPVSPESSDEPSRKQPSRESSEPAQQRGNTRARARVHPRDMDRAKELKDRRTVEAQYRRERIEAQLKLEMQADTSCRGPQPAWGDERKLREELLNLEWVVSSPKTPPADREFAQQRITELRAALSKPKGAAA
jgi:DNA-binding transcriptional ArsR family regulator